jgi:hypothetical protein
MKNTEISDLANDLMDLARAGELRCRWAGSLATSPSLKAHLILSAADHAADGERLRRLVVELRGTPHEGATAAVLADPLLESPQEAAGNNLRLLRGCIDEQAAVLARLDEAIGTAGLPEPAKSVFERCHESAQARHRSLTALAQALA